LLSRAAARFGSERCPRIIDSLLRQSIRTCPDRAAWLPDARIEVASGREEERIVADRTSRVSRQAARSPRGGPRRVLVLDGHPDKDRGRLIHALADAYSGGAVAAGHEVRRIDIATLDLHSLTGNADFMQGTPAAMVRSCQEDLAWAGHLVILFPLWLGDMPGLLKILLEQVARPGFAFAPAKGKGLPRKLLRGKSARIIVTMGMPAFFYRWYYRAHSVKSLERNILAFCGIAPVRKMLLGMVEGVSDAQRGRWLESVRTCGGKAL
jgi:putative NADPH-quinone reductase